jgi:thiol-disulfide isomerase/thioredoxin
MVLMGFILSIGVNGCRSKTVGPDWRHFDPRPPAPTFSAATLDGAPVTLDGFRGRVVVLDFWATWCPPCRETMPSLEHVHRKWKERGVTVLLVNAGEPADEIRPWLGRRFTAPIVLDKGNTIRQLYGVDSLPKLYIVDQAGRLAYAHTGYGGGLEHSLALILTQMTAETPPAAPAAAAPASAALSTTASASNAR